MALDRIKQYAIVHRLGAGAYGSVYYATDTLLQRPVVIKILDRASGAGDALRAMMLEEARLASALEHPNVCAIYEVGEYRGKPYIVMQYVPGRSLRQFIEEGPLSLPLALSLGIQIADGLAAAHRLGILHRDLKPANIMVTEDGAAKVLDFGLARRRAPAAAPETGPSAAPDTGITAEQAEASEQFGTTAYMAPEQFQLQRSSEQSDIFALGVILYEMVTGQHPLVPRTLDPLLVPHAMLTRQPVPPTALRPELPAALEEILLKALAKQPTGRFRYVFEVRDALKTVMRSLYAESGFVPGELSAILPSPTPTGKARPRLFSGLLQRLLPERSPPAASNALAVLPFTDLELPEESRFYGLAISNAVAMRLSRVPSLVVRPLGTSLSLRDRLLDPVETGKQLQAERVLLGSYFRSEDGLVVHWQLLEVASGAFRSGGTITVHSTEMAVLQNAIAERIHADLLTSGELRETTPRGGYGKEMEELPAEVRETYFEARALLADFASRARHRDGLERARQRYEWVIEQVPDFAAAHAGLGTVHLRFARNGFGGVEHLRAAERHFARALELEPDLREARLYRASTLLWVGEKERARLDVQYLLAAAADDADVYLAAGVVLQLDGLLEEALRVHGIALRLDRAVATRVYYYRARLLLMLGQREAALQEINKGLALAPDHTLLRNTLGYWFFYEEDIRSAIATLEAVLADDPNLRLAYPTLAMGYARAGRLEQAASLITKETLAAAAADAEIAYRLATYWAVAGDASAALSWLRTAIYRGNENFPWFARNPAWRWLEENEEYRKLLGDLEEVYRLNRPRWERVLAALPA